MGPLTALIATTARCCCPFSRLAFLTRNMLAFVASRGQGRGFIAAR